MSIFDCEKDREVDERAIFVPPKEIMKLFAQLLTLGLVGQGVVASNWFSKSSKFDPTLSCPRKKYTPSFYRSVSFEMRRYRLSSYQIAVMSSGVGFYVSSSIFHRTSNIIHDENIPLVPDC